MTFMQVFPDIIEEGKGPAYQESKLYGFTVFGKKGSKYEIKYDTKGEPVNKDEIEAMLRDPHPNQ